MGRDFKSRDVNDFWSFQIQSEDTSASSLKDKVRDFIGQAKSSWKSGEHTWAKCELKHKQNGNEKEEGTDQQQRRKLVGKEGDIGWPEGLYDFWIRRVERPGWACLRRLGR